MEFPMQNPISQATGDGLACPMPATASMTEKQAMQQMFAAKRIAVVGLSDNPGKPSHYVSEYLLNQGYDIAPVNPTVEEVMGRKCYSALEEVPRPIDVVLVFRRSELCADVARQAIAVGAKGVWLQSGIRNEEARRITQAAGAAFVQDRCMMVEHTRR
jgi:predicted CoA-binding protein